MSRAGFTDVRTILATGNVLLSSGMDATAVRRAAEESLRDAFGYEAWVLVQHLDAVRAISAAYPFEREVDGVHSYVTFVSDADVLAELAALTPGPDERIAAGDGVVYWQVPRTGTLNAAIGKTMGTKRYGSSTTTRNLRTVDKLLR